MVFASLRFAGPYRRRGARRKRYAAAGATADARGSVGSKNRRFPGVEDRIGFAARTRPIAAVPPRIVTGGEESAE
jgi:hypothetical protein